MENFVKFKRDEVIFLQGDDSKCMYLIRMGKVGIYLDFGGLNETKLAELMQDQFFGEMGMLDSAPRSTTAVSLEEGTELEVITEENYPEFFEGNSEKILLLLMQMCTRLHRTTSSYTDVCRTVRDAAEAESSGHEKSDDLLRRIQKYTAPDRSAPSVEY